jgi:hypothetical protein
VTHSKAAPMPDNRTSPEAMDERASAHYVAIFVRLV